MFGTPYYCGLLPEQSYLMNRRSDSGAISHRLDVRQPSKKSRKSEPIYEDVTGMNSGGGGSSETDSGVGTGTSTPRKISKFGSNYYEGVVTVNDAKFCIFTAAKNDHLPLRFFILAWPQI